MQQDSLGTQITELVKAQTGAEIVAAASGAAVLLSGVVRSTRDRDVAGHIAQQLAAGKRVENNIEVENSFSAGVSSFNGQGDTAPDGRSDRSAQNEHVTDVNDDSANIVPLETDEAIAAGAYLYEGDNDQVEEDSAFFPETDPVFTVNPAGNIDVLNGFAPSADDDTAPDLSFEDDIPGDEALIEAIQRQLHEDAATSALAITVQVEDGVAYLRGGVPHLEDAEAAEEVANRVPGVLEVVEELDIEDI